MENNFERSIQALGNTAFKQLQNVNIILFGVGGVGGWCAEALVRTGVQHLTIVDFDTVNPSNINRQVVATTRNIGQHKVEAMRERLLSINPQADIVAVIWIDFHQLILIKDMKYENSNYFLGAN